MIIRVVAVFGSSACSVLKFAALTFAVVMNQTYKLSGCHAGHFNANMLMFGGVNLRQPIRGSVFNSSRPKSKHVERSLGRNEMCHM